jgi:hypothetical protein
LAAACLKNVSAHSCRYCGYLKGHGNEAEEKIWVNFLATKLSLKLSKIWVWDPGSEIQDLEKNLFRILDPESRGSKRHRIRDPYLQHCPSLWIFLMVPKSGGDIYSIGVLHVYESELKVCSGKAEHALYQLLT